jgi:dTDP-4-dehydrorhamnose reductase
MNGKGNGFGTYHICGEPAASPFDFLQAVMRAYAPFTDRRPKLAPVSASSQPKGVPIPPYSVLNCDKIREAYGISPRSWHDDLAKEVKEYVQKRGEEAN